MSALQTRLFQLFKDQRFKFWGRFVKYQRHARIVAFYGYKPITRQITQAVAIPLIKASFQASSAVNFVEIHIKIQILFSRC